MPLSQLFPHHQEKNNAYHERFEQLPAVPSGNDLIHAGLDRWVYHEADRTWSLNPLDYGQFNYQKLNNLYADARDVSTTLDHLANQDQHSSWLGLVHSPYSLDELDRNLGKVLENGGLQSLDPNDRTYLNSKEQFVGQAEKFAEFAQPYTDFIHQGITDYSRDQMAKGNADPREQLSHWQEFDRLHGVLHDYPVNCFTRGTLISTPDGERPIEALAEGDLVDTQSGPQRVKWIGHRSIHHLQTLSDKARHNTLPVRVCQHAIADNVPSRDIVFSPWHHLYVHNVLVRAMDLVNGGTIRYEENAASVDYIHIELEQFNVIKAANLYSESFSDNGRNRVAFANSNISDLKPNWQSFRGMSPRPGFTVVRPYRFGDVLVAIKQEIDERSMALEAASPSQACA